MGLETGNYISDLVATNPTSNDPKSQGDDHLRLIKSVLKATFPLLTGAVNSSQTALNYVANVTSDIQSQLNAKGAIAGQIWSGVHNFTSATIRVATQAVGDSSDKAASTEFVAATAFSALLPGQLGNSGKVVTTDGTNAKWDSLFNLIIGNMPTIRPSLLLDFANAKTLDPRITFTRASVATRVNEKGLIETVSANQPRFDHDPVTGECKGLLIEEQRTNLLTYSEQFDNAAWTKIGTATVTTNNVISPDGTLSADTLNLPASGDRINPLGGTAVSSSSAYTGSIWLSGSGTIEISLANGNGTYAITTTEITLTSTPVRYSVTHATSATTTVLYFIVGRYNGTGTATSVAAWGAQIEAGSFATSYIPTTSAQVTRNADLASITGTNFSSWYRQDEGTVLCKADQNSNSSTSYIVSQNDTSWNNRIQLFGETNASISWYATSDGVNTLWSSAGTIAVNTTYVAVGTYKANNCACSLNGNAVVSDTSVTIPMVSQLNIGSAYNLTSLLNGHISKLAYYQKRLSNAELQALSTQ